MRYLTAISITTLVLLQNAFCGEKELNEMLDRRIELNKKYGNMFAEEAKGSIVEENLMPLEKKIGDEWVEYLKYVRTKNDPKLKTHVLRLEYLDEIRGCYYNLEYAENIVERMKINNEIANWKKELEALEKATEQE